MGGQTPTQERRSPRTFVKSRSGTDDLKSSTRRYNSQNSYSSARRAARALEEELNGLERPSSYVPKTTPSSSSISVSQTNDDFDSLSSTSRRLGRTLSLRERSSSPSSRRDFLLPSSRTNLGLLDSSLDRGRHIRPGIGSSTNSDAGDTLWDRPSTLSARRRVYNSSLSDSGACDLRKNPYDDKDLPPLPFLPRHTSRDSLKYLDSMKEKKKAECSEEDCTYYEILPYHKKESPNETLTRSCPPSAFLSNSTSTKTDNVSSHEPQIPTANELENISTTKGQEQTDSNLSNRQITEVGRCAEPRHVRSLSVTRDLKVPSNFKMEPQDTDLTSHVRMRRTSSSARTTPDRSILSKFFRHSTSDVKQLANEERSDAEEAGEKKVKPRRISRFLRPDFFDTPREESVYAKEKDMQKAALTHKMDGNEEKEATDKKQSTANKTSSRFLQSLEKKLEKLRGSSNETVTPVPEAEPSPSGRRIESTIRSLREKSLGPKESDSLPTESSLLKRAVSVSDFSPVETQGSKKIGGRVLGLFRRSNESSKKSNEMGTEGGKALIPTFTNKQSKPYLGSRSDSIVLKSDINGKTSVPATPDPSIGISSPISDYKINKIKSSVPEQSPTHKDTVTSSVVNKVQDRTTDTGTFVSQCSTSPPLEKDIKSIKKTADQQDHDALSMSLKSLPRNEVSVDSDKPFTKITTASVVVNTETESKLAENVTMEVPNTTSLSVVKRFKTAGESSEDCVVSPLKISSKIKSDKGILISKIKSKVPKLSRKDSSPKISDKGVLSAIPKEEKTVYDSTSDALKGTYAEDYKCDSPAPNMNKLAKAESRTDSSKSEKLDFAKSSSPVKSASKSKVPRQDKSYSSGTSSPTKTVTKIKENKDLDRAVTSSPPKSISKIRERRSNTPTKTSSKVTEEVKSTDTATAKEDTEDKKTAQAQFVSKIIDPKTEDSTSETTLVATADKNVSQVTSNSPTKMVSKKKDVKYVDRPNETSFATHTASDKKNTNATTKSCVVSLSKKKDSKDDKKVPESVAVLVTTEPFIKSKDINEGNKIHESMLTSTVEGISSSAVTAKALLKNSDAKDDFIKKETITTSPASDDNTVSGPTKSSTKSVVKNKGAIEESLICVTTPTPAASEDGKPSRSSTKSSTKSVSKNKDLRDEDKTHEANLILVSGEEAACGSPRTSTKAQKIKDSTKDDKASKTTMGKDNERALQPKSPSPIKTVVEFKDGGSETPSLSVTKDEKVISSTSISRTKLFSKGEGIKDERRTRDSTPTKPTKDDEKSVPNISRSSVKSSSRNKESKDLSPVKKTLKSNASRSSPFTKGSPPRFSRESSVDRRLSAEGSPEKLSKPPSRSPPKPVTKPLNCNLDVKQQGIPRRVPVTQPGLLRRSSSQSRSSSRDSQLESLGRRNSASGNEADIPVVSLKDVERRHRAMLMDKWSKSMQSLNVGKKEEGLPVKELQQTNIPSKKDNKDPNVSEENSSQLVLRADTVKKSKNLTEPGKLTDSKLNEPEDPVEISEIKPKDLKCPMEVSIGASGTSHAVDEVSNPQTSSVLKVATNGADTHQNTLESHEKMTGVPLASAPAPRPRLSLHLDLTPHSPAVRMSRKGTDTFTEDSLLSPTESESVDSWSVCSGDYSDTRDWAAFSPTLSPHSPTTEDTESVSDRIRRKSFYCRFNDIKKKKKPPSSIALSSSAIGSSYTLSPRSRAYPSEFTRSMSSSSGSSAPHYREKPHRSKSLLATSKDMEDSASLPHSYNQKHKSSISPTSALCSSPGHSRTSGVKSHNQNGSSESPLFSSPADRSPSWERSGMEIKNDILFHNLGLHRFDPTNLSVNKRTLLGMLSPTVVSPNQDSSSSPLFGDLAASGTTLVVSEDAIDTAKSGSAPDIDTASGGES